MIEVQIEYTSGILCSKEMSGQVYFPIYAAKLFWKSVCSQCFLVRKAVITALAVSLLKLHRIYGAILWLFPIKSFIIT
jgi:hypothetical protein